MNQKERAASCPKELHHPEPCGSKKVGTYKGKEKIYYCKNIVYLHSSMDHRYLVGRCSKCETQKAVKRDKN